MRVNDGKHPGTDLRIGGVLRDFKRIRGSGRVAFAKGMGLRRGLGPAALCSWRSERR